MFGLGIAYALTISLCVLEFTIGIKQSINKLFTEHLMLYIRRYIAYIVPIGRGDESAKHSKTSSDNSGTGRGQLD